jgi:hypothetical protein
MRMITKRIPDGSCAGRASRAAVANSYLRMYRLRFRDETNHNVASPPIRFAQRSNACRTSWYVFEAKGPDLRLHNPAA